MKNFETYCYNYQQYIQSLKKNTAINHTVTRCIWILFEWEKDNHLIASGIDKYFDAIELESERDPSLYKELILARETIKKLGNNII